MDARYLIQEGSGTIFMYTEPLMARGDMTECDKDGNRIAKARIVDTGGEGDPTVSVNISTSEAPAAPVSDSSVQGEATSPPDTGNAPGGDPGPLTGDDGLPGYPVKGDPGTDPDQMDTASLREVLLGEYGINPHHATGIDKLRATLVLERAKVGK